MLSAEEERGEVVRGLATRGERVSVLKRIRGPKITKNSWKSAYIKERARERKRRERKRERGRRREIEVMRLILCFLCFQRAAISVGYRAVAFFSFRSLHEEANFSPALVPLSISFFFSRSLTRAA